MELVCENKVPHDASSGSWASVPRTINEGSDSNVPRRGTSISALAWVPPGDSSTQIRVYYQAKNFALHEESFKHGGEWRDTQAEGWKRMYNLILPLAL